MQPTRLLSASNSRTPQITPIAATADTLPAGQPQIHVRSPETSSALLDAALPAPAARQPVQFSLVCAAQRGNPADVRVLLAEGADVNQADADGKTALMVAVNDADMVRELLSTGTDAMVARAACALAQATEFRYPIDILTNIAEQMTALPPRVEHDGLESVTQLAATMPPINLDQVDSSGRTALMRAAMDCETPSAHLLLQAGAKADQADSNGCTALIHAVMNGSTHIVEMLVHAKVKVDLTDSNGRTALTHAAMNGRASIVEALIIAEANVDHVDCYGRTPLMHAAIDSHTVETVFLFGVDASGRSKLFTTKQNGHAATVRQLLEAGADWRIRCKKGETALSLAIQEKHEEVVAILRSRDADTTSCRLS